MVEIPTKSSDATVIFADDGGLGITYNGELVTVEALGPDNGSTITFTITCAGYKGN